MEEVRRLVREIVEQKNELNKYKIKLADMMTERWNDYAKDKLVADLLSMSGDSKLALDDLQEVMGAAYAASNVRNDFLPDEPRQWPYDYDDYEYVSLDADQQVQYERYYYKAMELLEKFWMKHVDA